MYKHFTYPYTQSHLGMALLVHMELALIHKFDHCDNFHFEVRNQDCNTVPVGACIYVGDRVDKSELQLIASDDSLAFTIDTFDFLAIQQLQDRISEQLCGTQCKYNYHCYATISIFPLC